MALKTKDISIGCWYRYDGDALRFFVESIAGLIVHGRLKFENGNQRPWMITTNDGATWPMLGVCP